MKQLRTFTVLFVLGIMVCVTCLSTEDKKNPKELMPWREMVMACALHMRNIPDKASEAAETEVKQQTAADTDEDSGQIRVLLTHNQDGNYTFTSVTVSCNGTWHWAGEEKKAGEQVLITPESFSGEALSAEADMEGTCFSISYPDLAKQEVSYEGTLTFYPQEDGFSIVNTVSLETYVVYTIPGEMPASYPKEALKVQAVCSRTYAVCHKNGLEELHADLDDTVSWQVYNSQGLDERAKEAARETEGEILTCKDAPADTYFFSTSCGLTSTDDVWNTTAISSNLASVYVGKGNKMPQSEEEFEAYIRNPDPDAWESDRAWFRWTFTITKENLQKLADEKLKEAGTVKEMSVTARSGGWAATQLTISCEKKSLTVDNEYAIRQFLSPSSGVLLDAAGQEKSGSILPSAYFSLQPVIEDGILTKYIIYGGGYGHGVGMSQNGAADMAEAGMNYRDILHTFYRDVELVGIE